MSQQQSAAGRPPLAAGTRRFPVHPTRPTPLACTATSPGSSRTSACGPAARSSPGGVTCLRRWTTRLSCLRTDLLVGQPGSSLFDKPTERVVIVVQLEELRLIGQHTVDHFLDRPVILNTGILSVGMPDRIAVHLVTRDLRRHLLRDHLSDL